MEFETIRRAVAPLGLNLLGAVATTDYDAGVPAVFHLSKLYPPGKSVIVIGNGGGDFWRGFERAQPQLPPSEHPLDSYTVAAVETAVRPLLASVPAWRIFYPFRFASEPVSFMRLGECAGLGRRSLLGVLVHPVFGPWMALRAAISVSIALPSSTPLSVDPCSMCHTTPCMAACPAGAIGPANAWTVSACTSHRLQDLDPCANSCEARWHCLYGREYRYPAAALRHHQRYSLSTMRTYAA